MLAVVEDEQHAGDAQPLEQRRLAARRVEGRDDRVEHVVGARGGFEASQPDAARLRATRRDRDGRLADAAGTDDLDQPLRSQQARQRSELRVAADELDLK